MAYHRLLTLLFLFLAFIATLAMGAVRASRDRVIRGIPQALPLPMNHAGVRLGINVSLDDVDSNRLAATLEEISATGAEAIKHTFYYQQRFDWEASDRIIDAVTQSRLELVPLLDGHPDDSFQPPVDLAGYAAWAGEFARRYGDSLNYYMIWDEPNLSTHWGNRDVSPAEYAALLSAAANAIRNADPGAAIISAPLAPTVETGPKNLSDAAYLQQLYDAAAATAFDIVAVKPYGFDSSPDDREVNPDTLNFSRVILLREVMELNGDGTKALWAGNWGWNSLPPDWPGKPSIWGQVEEETQVDWTLQAIERARTEWPWMGYMFLENWQPDAPAEDPRWGFSIARRPVADALQGNATGKLMAYPGFWPAQIGDPTQIYEGKWRFSPDFGADVGSSGDSMTFHFWGTDIGLRVRRANNRARFHLLVDGQPANALPMDDEGAALVLNSPDPTDVMIETMVVAENLPPGQHTLNLQAIEGVGQWPLEGFSVGFQPPDSGFRSIMLTGGLFVLTSLIIAGFQSRRANWGDFGERVSARFHELSIRAQLTLTSFAAAFVAAAGWLTWGDQATGVYRRLGDGNQLALTAGAASIFYLSPSFVIYVVALIILLCLLVLRPAWGLVLIAFSIPFYVQPKVFLGYRFSPVEVFLLLTLAAFGIACILSLVRRQGLDPDWRKLKSHVIGPDLAVFAFVVVATFSLFFAERLDVAANEWRVVIMEPVLFYLLFRVARPQESEMWTILDAYILGGTLVAIIGLWQYATGQNLITSESGLMRLRSIYGSPNNVALFLGRMVPLLIAVSLMGLGRRRKLYIPCLAFISLAIALTFSKGAFFVGLPLSILVIVAYWRRSVGGRVWPWFLGTVLVAAALLLLALQVPQLAGRLNLQGQTVTQRLYLWRSSLNMIRDHPIFGVGPDNFLYAYRGRYIFDGAWHEPNLSHPHNTVLDFATRLGLSGLVIGIWLFWSYWQTARGLPTDANLVWRSVAIGLIGSLVYILAHGMVDHSFFLIDLAYTFFLFLGTLIWIRQYQTKNRERAT